MQRMLESVQYLNFRLGIQTKLQLLLMIKKSLLTQVIYLQGLPKSTGPE